MYVCRLFHRDRPFEQVEARVLAEGRITLGRDPGADWPVTDPDGVLSRQHCTLAVEQGRLWLTDLSTNGVFLADGERAPAGQPVELQTRQMIRFGALTLLVDELQAEAQVAPAATTLSFSPLSPAARPQRSEAAPADAGLLEAFCEGARLDGSALSSEEPAELMRRAGAVYREAVLGLASLMAERARFKEEHGLERTTIGAAQNNPFKWTSSRMVAKELLLHEAPNFLHDGSAVRASFADLHAHMGAMAEGVRAAVGLAVEAMAPEAIHAEAQGQGGLLKSRAAACWDVHNRRHAALKAETASEDGVVRRALSRVYAQAPVEPSASAAPSQGA